MSRSALTVIHKQIFTARLWSGYTLGTNARSQSVESELWICFLFWFVCALSLTGDEGFWWTAMSLVSLIIAPQRVPGLPPPVVGLIHPEG